MADYNHALFVLREENRHLETILKQWKSKHHEEAKKVRETKLKDLDEAIKKLTN